MNYKLILASNSPRRKELLAELGMPFEVRVLQDIDEEYPGDLPVNEVARYIAKEKADAYRRIIAPDELIITADTVVIVGDEILGKPVDEADAVRMLKLLSGRTHQVTTGVCLLTAEKESCFDVTTDVTFKALSDDEIHYYVNHYRPFDKAGAYGIQEWIGYIGVTGLHGSYYNVMGLPVQRIYQEAAVVAVQAQITKPAIPRDAALEAKVEKTLAKMTLDEKIGQMLELNLDVMGKMTVENAKVDREKVRSVLQQYGRPDTEIEAMVKMTDQEIIDKLGAFPVDIYQGETRRLWKINETMLDTLISKWKVGSILNAPGSSAATRDQWLQWISQIQEKSMKYLGIPDIYGLDHNHGVTYTLGGTLFPQPINLGASFNTELARRGAEITAYESRAASCPWVYNPVVDLSRDPRWPRVYESFGEDAIVNSKMVVAEIRGYQGDDNNHIDQYHVGTSTKHYFAYGAPWSGKDRTPAYLNPQMIREKYFEPFKAAALACLSQSADDPREVFRALQGSRPCRYADDDGELGFCEWCASACQL